MKNLNKSLEWIPLYGIYEMYKNEELCKNNLDKYNESVFSDLGKVYTQAISLASSVSGLVKTIEDFIN